MQNQKRRDTSPEIELRSALHRQGLRFRIEHLLPAMRRRADIVFPRQRVAVFVDGCFWHGCPEHRTAPKANADWWRAKIESNVTRDRDTDARLAAAGWLSLRVWEHEQPHAAAAMIGSLVRSRRSQNYDVKAS